LVKYLFDIAFENNISTDILENCLIECCHHKNYDIFEWLLTKINYTPLKFYVIITVVIKNDDIKLFEIWFKKYYTIFFINLYFGLCLFYDGYEIFNWLFENKFIYIEDINKIAKQNKDFISNWIIYYQKSNLKFIQNYVFYPINYEKLEICNINECIICYNQYNCPVRKLSCSIESCYHCVCDYCITKISPFCPYCQSIIS
jgi:hypothetical protein